MVFLQRLLMAIIRPIMALFFGIFRMVAFVLILLVAAYIFWRGAMEGAVTRTMEQVLGVPVEIRGDVALATDTTFGLTVTDLAAANPDWAAQDDLLTIDNMTVYLNPVALIMGRTVINEVTMNGLSVSLERGANGLANYDAILMRQRAGVPVAAPVIGAMHVRNAVVFIRDDDLTLTLDIPRVDGSYNTPAAPGALMLEGLNVTAPGCDLSASLLIEPGADPPRISGMVQGRLLDMAQLMPKPRPPMPPRMGTEEAPGLQDALARFVAQDAPILRGVDLNIRIKIDDLRLPGFAAADVRTILRQEGGVPTLQAR